MHKAKLGMGLTCLVMVGLQGCHRKPSIEVIPEERPITIPVVKDPATAAGLGLSRLKATIVIDTAKSADGMAALVNRVAMTGIKDTVEGNLAQTGKPFLKLLLGCSEVQKTEVLRHGSLRTAAIYASWIYPVLVRGEIRSQLFVDSIAAKGLQKAGFYTSAFGDTGLIKSFGRVVASLKILSADTTPTGLLQVPGMQQWFVYRGLDSAATLIPLPGFSLPNLFGGQKQLSKDGSLPWKLALQVLANSGLGSGCLPFDTHPHGQETKASAPDSTTKDSASQSAR